MATRPITIAVMAMGGEGGGVLADWIVAMAEAQGWIAQSTSVPGVAQRTGATIYYVELFPGAEAAGRSPVLALMPLPGDVDIVLASELMEAGRAVLRGLVTPDRTTLVASTHRVHAIAETTAMGDGRVDPAPLLANAKRAAQRLVAFDMAAMAASRGSVISAVLFGALAGSRALPFERAAFEAAIRAGGVGVTASLAAFDAAFAAAERSAGSAAEPAVAAPEAPPATAASRLHVDPRIAVLLARIAELPEPTRELATHGTRRLVDYQDPAYAALYLDRLEQFAADHPAAPAALLQALARHLALWMSYEDLFRVAELKTRATRFERVEAEAKPAEGALVAIDEYLHPRIEELCDALPPGLAARLQAPGILRSLALRFTRKGRIVRTTSLRGFLLLHFVARRKAWRLRSTRHAAETARIEAWLETVRRYVDRDPGLAHELVLCQGLVKGYSDTHARGLRNFAAILDAVGRTPTVDGPTVRNLREAALADEAGHALAEAVRRLDAARALHPEPA